MDDVNYEYCLYGPNGQHEPEVKPLAAGGVTNKCKHCGLTMPQQDVPEMDPF